MHCFNFSELPASLRTLPATEDSGKNPSSTEDTWCSEMSDNDDLEEHKHKKAEYVVSSLVLQKETYSL